MCAIPPLLAHAILRDQVPGWRVLEHIGYEELAERYVKQTGLNLRTMAIERMVYAEKE